ncbi:MAG: hypothetical protein ACJ8F7_01365 [Gemmataceae bacterium]
MIVLQVSDVVAAMDMYLAGRLDAAELEAWAERQEMAEDVEYVDAEREAVTEAVFLLANPSINGALTPDRIRQVRADLLENGRDAEPGRGN